MIFFDGIGWLGILLAFIVYFILGALWFTTFFKKQYLDSLGINEDEPQEPQLIFILGPAVCTLFITLTTGVLIYALNIDSYSILISFALLIGIGFLVANTMNIAINPNIPKPMKYGFISSLYHLIGIIIVCIIIFVMK